MAKGPNKATSTTPQVVVLVMDDSGSMEDSLPDLGVKAKLASEGLRQMLMDMQAVNVGASVGRFYVSLLKFGDKTTVMAECEPPKEVKLRTVHFEGKSGRTNMAVALHTVREVLDRSFAKVRAQVPGYRESESPGPLVMFFSDGNNTGGPVDKIAKEIHQLRFAGGAVQVVAVGIGMEQEHFKVMQSIASSADLAVNIDPALLPEFLADVGTTFVDNGATIRGVVDNYRR